MRIGASAATLVTRASAMAAAVAGTRTLPPSILITDFDGTVTAIDTTPLVPHLAARGQGGATAGLLRFRELEERYLTQLSQCKDTIRAQRADVGAAISFDAEGLEAALAAMDEVSNTITEELSQTGVLAGIAPASVAPAIAEWRAQPSAAPCQVPALREGCEQTLAGALACGWRLGILSLNWCPPVIHALLPVLKSFPPPADVWCNSIDEASGRVSNTVNGAVAKREIIEKLVKQVRESSAAASAEDGHRPLVVYVGDSATDLLAMLAADVGILIGESGWSREIAERFGLVIEPLDQQDLIGTEARREVVFEAQSWLDIKRCLGI